MAHQSLEERFWDKVIIREPDKCWEWIANKNTCGYGLFALKASRPKQIWRGAHRVAWMIAKGPIPNDLFVLHTCNNRSCVNPSHLKLGTQTDNMQDALKAGHHTSVLHPESTKRGVQLPTSKLTDDQVREIRWLSCHGVRTKALARNYSVSRANINRIVNYQMWRHVS